MSTLAANSLLDIFASPLQVFQRIREKSISAWWPLLILLGATTAVYGWYFMSVDLYQFMETSMVISGQTPAPEEMDAIMQGASVIRIVSLVSASVGSLVMFLLLALFFFLAATLIAEEKFSYGQFLSLIAWSSLPAMITLLSTGVTYGLADGFVYLTELDKTSLASLLGMSLEQSNYDLASNVTIANIWSYVLFGVGFSILTRSSAVASTIVALIPPVLHFGLVYLF